MTLWYRGVVMEQASVMEGQNVKDIIIRGVFSISIPLSSILYGFTNKNRGNVHILQSSVDTMIPFNQYFILPYIFWYIYVAFFLFYFCAVDKEIYYKLLMSIVLGEIVCCLIFYIFPTYVPRPNVQGDDICSALVRAIYKSDNPYNGFPSIHVLDSIFVAVFVFKTHKLNKLTKIISLFFALSVIISTMFIKQHYFVDAVSAALLSWLLYMVAGVLYNVIYKFIKNRKKLFNIQQ